MKQQVIEALERYVLAPAQDEFERWQRSAARMSDTELAKPHYGADGKTHHEMVRQKSAEYHRAVEMVEYVKHHLPEEKWYLKPLDVE